MRGGKRGEKEKKEGEKRKKALVREKRLKKIRAPRHPSGGSPGAPPAGPSGGRPGSRGLGWGLVCFAEVLLVFEDSLGPAPPVWTVTLPSKYRALTGSEMLSAFFRLRSTM